ncbi:uncharacterized protein LOC105202354 [Solenopsis invicta]|uniref:uncharacterized protein LOC105202354 n=1 Tax=Solenopsis invicta TaxID=13686 RepID=UPI00193CCB67|nr:uncharacterized protein LOC105202354 [Solenopsis invicta]
MLGKSSTRVNKMISNANLSTRKLWNNASKSTRHSIAINDVIEEENELIGALTKQLHLAESQMRKMQSVLTKTEEGLRTKDQEIGRLKRKIKEWETKYKSQELVRKKEQRSQANNFEYFYQRCLGLEHKIKEMEKFLADYGLIWVGDPKSTANVDGSNDFINACYEQLVANIDQLNLAVGKGEVYIHHEKGGGATFKTPSCMALKFYKNGMCVNGGPLRSYNDPTAISFIRDILDGYFPSELQCEYPDGVPFMIEDRRIELHVDNSASFPGQGYRLGKQSPVDNLLPANSRKSTNVYPRSTRANPSPKDNTPENIPPLSLPNRYYHYSVWTNKYRNILLDPGTSLESPSADLFSLRSQILASHNNVCSNTHLQSHINAELVRSSRREKPPVLCQINEATGKSNELRLKVRSLTGSIIYLVHVLADESVAKLYELLDKAMQTSGYRGYKVVLSGYSSKRLHRINTSLKENGISRDCVLHLVND